MQGGPSPKFVVAELSTRGAERYVPAEEMVGRELRSRLLNPKYATAMRDDGYAGLREVWKSVEYLWGWQMTYPEAVAEADWQEVYDVWVADRDRLGLAAAFEKASPFARQGIAARLLETTRKGYWKPPQETLAGLAKTLVEGVAKNGVGCDSLTCNNPELRKYATEVAGSTGAVSAKVLQTWNSKLEQATGQTLPDALAQRTRDKERWRAPPEQTPKATKGVRAGAQPVKGYKMAESRSTIENKPPRPRPRDLPAGVLLLLLSLLAGACRRWVGG